MKEEEEEEVWLAGIAFESGGKGESEIRAEITYVPFFVSSFPCIF